MVRHSILFSGGGLEAAPGRTGADLLDYAGGGRHPVYPGGAMRCGVAMELPPMDSGPVLRDTGNCRGADVRPDPQPVAGAEHLGLYGPTRQFPGTDLPTIQRPVVGLVPDVYPGL